jgi:hypothetical protein
LNDSRRPTSTVSGLPMSCLPAALLRYATVYDRAMFRPVS